MIRNHIDDPSVVKRCVGHLMLMLATAPKTHLRTCLSPIVVETAVKIELEVNPPPLMRALFINSVFSTIQLYFVRSYS